MIDQHKLWLAAEEKLKAIDGFFHKPGQRPEVWFELKARAMPIGARALNWKGWLCYLAYWAKLLFSLGVFISLLATGHLGIGLASALIGPTWSTLVLFGAILAKGAVVPPPPQLLEAPAGE